MSNSSSKWPFLLPVQSSNTITVGPAYQITKEQQRKGSVMTKLFHVGVVFRHKGSKVSWQVTDVHKDENGSVRFVTAKSLKSGYRKALWPDEYSYDHLILEEAPEAVKVLFGDKKHGNEDSGKIISDTPKEPETPDNAFEEAEVREEDLSGD